MKRHHLSETFTLAAIAFAATSGIAQADDSSLSLYGGDSYSYFREADPATTATPSAKFGAAGRSEREYQSVSSGSPVWQLGTPTYDRASSTFHAQNPQGLAYSDYQARASNGSMWQTPATQTTPDAPSAARADSNGFATRIANLFRER